LLSALLLALLALSPLTAGLGAPPPQRVVFSEDFETCDFRKLPWRTYEAKIDKSEYHSGRCAAELRPRGYIELTYTVPRGVISFYINLKESGNGLTFYVDGKAVKSWSSPPRIRWEKVSFPVPPGTHTFRWENTGTGCCTEVDDIVYLTEVTPPLNVIHVRDPGSFINISSPIRLLIVNSTIGTLIVGGGVCLNLTNTRVENLTYSIVARGSTIINGTSIRGDYEGPRAIYLENSTATFSVKVIAYNYTEVWNAELVSAECREGRLLLFNTTVGGVHYDRYVLLPGERLPP